MARQALSVIPELIERLGARQQVHFRLADRPEALGVASLEADACVTADQPLTLWVETDRLLLFDPRDGRRLR